MKGELSGVVGPVSPPIPSVRASSPAWRGPAVAGGGERDPRSGDAGHNRAAGGRWTGEAVPMTTPETAASRWIFF